MISSDIPDLPPPLPTLPLPDDDEDEVDRSTRSRDSHSQEASSVRDSSSASPAQNTIAIPNTERLIGAGPAVKSMTVERREEDRTDANNIPPLPEALEQKIMINKDAEEVRRRSRSRSLDRKGATIININHDDPEIPPISSLPAAPQPVQAPLVSPSDLSTSVTANVRSFEKISLKSVTTDESSTDPEPSAAPRPSRQNNAGSGAANLAIQQPEVVSEQAGLGYVAVCVRGRGEPAT